MNRILLAAAATALVLTAAACSADNSAPPAPGANASPADHGDPVGYLYEVDHHAHTRAQATGLVARLRQMCSDDPLGIEFAATNRALDLVKGAETADVYALLDRLLDDRPADGPKAKCQPLLAHQT